MKVVVAGAGLAGLYAAWKLLRAGHEVVVLEASNRVGGRSWSKKLPNGEAVELGGEFIEANDYLIRQLCAEFKLPLVAHGMVLARRNIAGRRLTIEEYSQSAFALKAATEKHVLDGDADVSLTDAAREAFGAAYDAHPYFVRLATSLTGNTDQISAYGLTYNETGEPLVEHASRVLAGNNAVADAIHHRIGPVVRLETSIVSIQQDRSRVTVATSAGEELGADAAILAIPLPKLKALLKGHTLPELIGRAIQTRHMGVGGKIGIVAKIAKQDVGRQPSGERWWVFGSASPAGEGTRPALSGFAGGEQTMRDLNLSDGGKTWRKKIKDFVPEYDLSDDEMIVADWSDNQYTGGSYSSPGVGWRPEFDGAFNELYGRIAIAGEHTNPNASMNLALRSGLRASRQLMVLADA